MRLLIDGYNLLHATDLFGVGELAGTLRGSREALVGFLATRLTEKERSATVVVFDAAEAPPGLPDRIEHAGMDLRFARDYPDADTMIEALLEGVHGAKHLTVVSGDRRVQRAARASGAKWVDSEPWFTGLARRSSEAGPRPTDKPAEAIGSPDQWVEAFSDPSALAAIEKEAADAPLPRPRQAASPDAKKAKQASSAAPAKPSKKKRRRRPPMTESTEKPSKPFGAGIFDPFPPGYADDLLDSDPPAEGEADRPKR